MTSASGGYARSVARPLLRIGELSRRTGVSVELLRAWERRYGLLHPERTSGGFRLYGADDVARVRLMQHYLERHMSAAQAADLVLRAHSATRAEHPGIPVGDARKAVQTLGAGLEHFDEGPADQILDRLLEVFTPCAVLTDVVLPYLRSVGDRWACAELTVAQEHFASRYLESRLRTMGRGWGRGSGPTVVLACLPGEQHCLGLLSFGVVLRDLGRRVVYLGPDTPIDAAADAAREVAADALVVAAVDPRVAYAARERLAEVAREVPVALGGPAAAMPKPPAVPQLPQDLLAAARALVARDQPLTTPSGRSLATRRASPASSTTETTRSTSL